jgi:hypothetical protein
VEQDQRLALPGLGDVHPQAADVDEAVGDAREHGHRGGGHELVSSWRTWRSTSVGEQPALGHDRGQPAQRVEQRAAPDRRAGAPGVRRGVPQGHRQRAAQPAGHEGVARLQRARPGPVPRRAGVVVGDDVVDVRDAPACRGEVLREQRLLAEEEHDPAEAAHGQVGRAADDRTAGDEAEHRRAGQVRPPLQRAVGHLAADGSSRPSGRRGCGRRAAPAAAPARSARRPGRARPAPTTSRRRRRRRARSGRPRRRGVRPARRGCGRARGPRPAGVPAARRRRCRPSSPLSTRTTGAARAVRRGGRGSTGRCRGGPAWR